MARKSYGVMDAPKSCKSGILLIGLVASVAIGWQSRAQGGHDDNPDYPSIALDNTTIRYEDTPATDAVAQLEEKLEAGQTKLDYDAKFGYLPSVLKNLNLNV